MYVCDRILTHVYRTTNLLDLELYRRVTTGPTRPIDCHPDGPANSVNFFTHESPHQENYTHFFEDLDDFKKCKKA
jgi:hypothetical protein